MNTTKNTRPNSDFWIESEGHGTENIMPNLTHNTNPHFESHPNPIRNAPFSHYEIQTAREFATPDGRERFFQAVTDAQDCDNDNPQAVSPVLFAIYGRLTNGTVEHITDRKTLNDARETLRNAGIIQ